MNLLFTFAWVTRGPIVLSNFIKLSPSLRGRWRYKFSRAPCDASVFFIKMTAIKGRGKIKFNKGIGFLRESIDDDTKNVSVLK